MNPATQPQTNLRLLPAPHPETVAMLFQMFGDVLIPLDRLRTQYFQSLNEETFRAALTAARIQLPITTLDTSRKAGAFAHIRHLAALIDSRAYQADEDLARRLPTQQDHEQT